MKATLPAITAIALAAAACSPSSAAADNRATAAQAPANTDQTKLCADDNLHRAKCMIELILADLEREYGAVDGGGISEIRGLTSTSYAVSLPFEERVVTRTYVFELKPGAVSIKSRTSTTKSY